ncbi:MAG: DNA internalization-related competence protein ComEC/Rec2 [Lachnospiraceae bacterium]|nr:DNA internalization-related competence protein ComEC/Rec2 [Lachnospiraceae bacterium]
MRRPLCLLCLFYVMTIVLVMCLWKGEGKEPVLPKEGESLILEGRLYQIKTANTTVSLYLESGSDKIVCYLKKEGDWQEQAEQIKIGSLLKVKGVCRHFESAHNDGQFDQAAYYRAQGIDLALSGCTVISNSREFDPLGQGLYSVRQALSDILSQNLPARYAGVMRAMLLGEREALDEDVEALFQRNGIFHVLAISALHISFLGMGMFSLLKKIRIPHCGAALLALLFVMAFGKMIGETASALRSIMMFSLLLTAGLCRRTYDMLTAIAVSAVCLLTIKPLYITQSGFLLSFGAVMGLALILPFIQERTKPSVIKRMILPTTKKERFLGLLKEKLAASLAAGVSVFAATFPIQLYFFYTYAPYSILLNLLIVPLVGVLLWCGAAGLMLTWVFPKAGVPAFLPCKLILMIMEGLCHGTDALPYSNLILGKPAFWKIIVYYVVLVLMILFHKRLKLRTLTIAFLFLLGFVSVHPRTDTVCTMLDVGQGECIVIEEKSGLNIMVDGGSSDISEVGKYRMVPYLKSHGISRLDYVFLSHGDLDHLSGIKEILEDADMGITIGYLVMTKFALEDADYASLVNLAKKQNVRLLYVTEGDLFALGNTAWRCLYPHREERGEGNDQSMVLAMECRGTKMLFTGDLSEEKEKELLLTDVDILKCGHHGSKYSTSENFLKNCKPEAALISAGRNNTYGHPHQETLKRLTNAGSKVYATNEGGAITIRFGKGKYSILTYGKMCYNEPK